MPKIVKQAIDCQLAAFSTAGYPPAAILLSGDKYTELLQELAYDSATDDIEPIAERDGILVVTCPADSCAPLSKVAVN